MILSVILSLSILLADILFLPSVYACLQAEAGLYLTRQLTTCDFLFGILCEASLFLSWLQPYWLSVKAFDLAYVLRSVLGLSHAFSVRGICYTCVCLSVGFRSCTSRKGYRAGKKAVFRRVLHN